MNLLTQTFTVIEYLFSFPQYIIIVHTNMNQEIIQSKYMYFLLSGALSTNKN